MSRKKVVDLSSARSFRYRKTLAKIARDGKCPFCPGNFLEKNSRVIKRVDGWFLVHNFQPYANARVHLLLVPTRHLERFSELSASDFASITRLVDWATTQFRVRGGAFLMRFGSTKYTGATVCHLHAHLVAPKYSFKTKRAKVVQFPVG
ncbi:MAG: HIT domain-containing protein [Patescibacteria group bacterium]